MTNEVGSPKAGPALLEHSRPRTIAGLDGLRACAGTDLGVSNWLVVEQSMIDLFAQVTGDEQWIHVDPARAKEGPFGSTVAHGFLSRCPVACCGTSRSSTESARSSTTA